MKARPYRLVLGLVLLLATIGGATPAIASTSGVVISEFRFRGPSGGNDEFIELVNQGSEPVEISGWKIRGCNSAGTIGDRANIPGGVTLASGEHFLLTNTASLGYSGSVPGDISYTTGVTDTGGIQLVDPANAVIDAAGTTTAPASCREGAGLPGLGATTASNLNRSYERKPGVVDSNDNPSDFELRAPSTPQRWGLTPGARAVKINQIQGPGANSPYAGLEVEITGVVTGWDDEIGQSSSGQKFTEDAGIFVQEEVSDYDADPRTSEGIFVGHVRERAAYPIGTLVRIQGKALEKFGQTWIDEKFGTEPIDLGTAPIPVAVEIDEAAAESQEPGARAYYESLEGMRVVLPVSVANSGGTNKFGELFLTPGPEIGRVYRTSVVPGLIGTDEDAGSGDPDNPLSMPFSTTTVNADLFDRVENVVGPLTFGFENYKIMVQPSEPPVVVKGPIQYPYEVPEAGAREIRIATYNLLNYFPVGGSNDNHTITEAEFEEKTAELAAAIEHLGRPEVIGVQEATTLGVVEALAERLGDYTAYLLEGNDERGIDVGYLIRDTVTASNLRQLGKDETTTLSDCADSQASGLRLLFDRPPLALDVVAGGVGFTIVNNHFASKSHPDSCRAGQATFVRDFVASIEAGGGNAIVTGDLNSFEDEVALTILEGPETSLTNLWSMAPADERYSFAFQGRLQTLDHMLVTDGLDARVGGFRYVHLNNDYYDRPAVDGHKASDHDPAFLTLSTNRAPGVEAADATVGEGSSVLLSATATDPDGGSLSYDWDLDGNGSYEVSGATPSFSAAGIDGPATRTVGVRVTDDAGATATDTATVTISNVAPSATFNTPSAVFAGNSFELSLTSPTDPSAADVAAGFTYSFDCGAGSGPGAYSASSSITCSTADVGTRTVRGSIRDKDGGVRGYEATVVVSVTPASLCALTHSYVTNAGVAHAMCEKLAHGAYGAYVNQVEAQAGKTLTAEQAATLIRLAGRL